MPTPKLKQRAGIDISHCCRSAKEVVDLSLSSPDSTPARLCHMTWLHHSYAADLAFLLILAFGNISLVVFLALVPDEVTRFWHCGTMKDSALFTNSAEIIMLYHRITSALTLLNELGLLSTLWIVSSAPSTIPSRYNVSATWTTIVYALSEPAWSLVLQNVPLPSWIPAPDALVYSASLHGYFMILSAHVLSARMISDPESRPSLPSSPTYAVYATYLIPIETAALQNACIFLWAQGSRIPVDDQSHSNVMSGQVTLLLSCIMFSICSAWSLSIATSRAWFFRFTWDDMRSQLCHLAMLVSLRLVARNTLGLEVFPCFETV